jgi:hypothetical protein
MKWELLLPSLIVVLALGFAGAVLAGEKGEVVALSELIGTEIDKTERETYGLFPDLKGFETGRLVRLSETKYRLDFAVMDGSKLREKSRRVSAESYELTVLHVRMVEEHLSAERTEMADQDAEARFLRRLALKYGSRTRYDIASQLLADLRSDYPGSYDSEEIQELEAGAARLWRSPRPLFKPASLIDPGGRTGLLIFAGYYGAWLGLATPIALDADSPGAYGAGLLIVPPLSIFVAHTLTKNADISEGRSKMISFGGHLGTWQGIGWGAVTNMKSREVVGVGELSGLAGIAAAALLTDRVDYTAGQAELAHAGMSWGAWFGIVYGVVADHEDDDLLLVDVLVGSDVFAISALAARNIQISKKRVRLISMSGVLGTLAGFGVDLVFKVDSEEKAFALAGAGGVAGLAIGSYMTRNMDEGTFLGMQYGRDPASRYAVAHEDDSWSIASGLSGRRHPFVEGRVIPSLSVRIGF